MDRDVVETAFRFVESINRQEVEKLTDMMTDSHRFVDLSGEEHVGRAVMRKGWLDYFRMCPDYLIHVCEFHHRGDRVYLIGRTTGSHLDLPWREEFQDTVIWIADVEGERLSLWKVVADTPETRQAYGIPGQSHPEAPRSPGQQIQCRALWPNPMISCDPCSRYN